LSYFRKIVNASIRSFIVVTLQLKGVSMLKRKFAAVILVAVLCSAACTSDQQKKLAPASDDMAKGIATALALDDALIKGNLISKDDAIAVTSAILDVNRIAGQFTAVAKTYNGSATTKAQLVGLASQIGTAIQKLNDSGVLHVKNPQSKAQLDAAVAVMQSALA